MNSALIKRLRKIATLESEDYGAEPQDHSSWQAADVIERQAAQIEGLNGRFDKDQYRIACQADRLAKQAAHIEQMREVLEFMWRDVPMNEYAFEKCEKAISTTPDQALEQFAAKVREQCAMVCENEYPYTVFHTDQRAVINCAAAIRTIKELPK